METTRQQVEAAATELIAEVGLSFDFINSLNAGDDWSFIVKLHALIEAGITHALVVHVAKDGVQEIFANLELSNSKTGKLAFADLYLDLESEDRRFIRSLSELRNTIVHDVRNVSLNLKEHFAEMPIEEKRRFMKAFAYAEQGQGETSPELDTLVARHGENVRPIILRAAMFLLAVLQLQACTERAVQEATKSRLEIAALLRSNNSLQPIAPTDGAPVER